MKALAIISIAALTITAMSSGVHAKDWFKKVDLIKDGIDAVPIDVRAGSNNYTSMKSTKHRFLLRSYSKAKSGKVIVSAHWLSGSGTAKKWDEYALQRGSNRELKATHKSHLALNKVSWVRSPVRSCKNLLNAKTAQGMSKNAVLSKEWTTTAIASFAFEAYARRKIHAKQVFRPTYSKKKSLNYKVQVRCLAK